MKAHYQSLEYEKVLAVLRHWSSGENPRRRILDFGCGKGRYLRGIASLGLVVVGVDANPTYISEARSAGFAAYSPDELDGEVAGGFDVILLSHVVEHLGPAELAILIPRLCRMLRPDGRLIILTPTPGERFYHDFSHVRPYLPQSIRHAFGQTGAPISFGERSLLELVDIYFFRDPYRTRSWRSFYIGTGVKRSVVNAINSVFDIAWRLTGGRIGVTSSWLGVFKVL